MEEAEDESNPLFERLRFLSIFASNLDEFYMVRIGSLQSRRNLGKDAADLKTGLTPKQQLSAISTAVKTLCPQKDQIYKKLMKELSQYNAYIGSVKLLSGKSRRELKSYFTREILPLLSPRIIDSKHPFGHLENKALFVGVGLKSKNGSLYGIIPCPKDAPRLYHVESTGCYLLLEDIILKYADMIFNIYKVRCKTVFRVTRSADTDISESLFDEDGDYREFISEILKSRSRLEPVRLETGIGCDDALKNFFRSQLTLSPSRCFESESPLDLSFVSALAAKIDPRLKAKLFYLPFHPKTDEVLLRGSIINEVLSRDILISCPYESMRPVIDLLAESARSDEVKSIKITLYRVSSQSQIISSLCAAAENGKDVTVMIELSARFDEKNNIAWSSMLEEAGCHVIYGIEGVKVHSKLMLITGFSAGKIFYISHFGTGNYNEVTSRIYTDLSLLTSDKEIGEDSAAFFQNLTIGNLYGDYRHLLVSPASLKPGIIKLIRTEAKKAQSGENGRIIAKMNSLSDKDIIDEFISAADKGVKINLIIRGICCLRPTCSNIEIRSIVGRFLEHSRIYCFGEGEKRKVYISSADMMTRNTERRIETAVPVNDPKLSSRISDMLNMMLKDNVKAKILRSNGEYQSPPKKKDEKAVSSQSCFLQ